MMHSDHHDYRSDDVGAQRFEHPPASYHEQQQQQHQPPAAAAYSGIPQWLRRLRRIDRTLATAVEASVVARHGDPEEAAAAAAGYRGDGLDDEIDVSCIVRGGGAAGAGDGGVAADATFSDLPAANGSTRNAHAAVPATSASYR